MKDISIDNFAGILDDYVAVHDFEDFNLMRFCKHIMNTSSTDEFCRKLDQLSESQFECLLLIAKAYCELMEAWCIQYPAHS